VERCSCIKLGPYEEPNLEIVDEESKDLNLE